MNWDLPYCFLLVVAEIGDRRPGRNCDIWQKPAQGGPMLMAGDIQAGISPFNGGSIHKERWVGQCFRSVGTR